MGRDYGFGSSAMHPARMGFQRNIIGHVCHKAVGQCSLSPHYLLPTANNHTYNMVLCIPEHWRPNIQTISYNKFPIGGNHRITLKMSK